MVGLTEKTVPIRLRGCNSDAMLRENWCEILIQPAARLSGVITASIPLHRGTGGSNFDAA